MFEPSSDLFVLPANAPAAGTAVTLPSKDILDAPGEATVALDSGVAVVQMTQQPPPPASLTNIPAWPIGVCQWWYQVQAAAFKDAVDHLLNDTPDCPNLSVVLKPWLASVTQLELQLQAQMDEYARHTVSAKRLIKTLNPSRQIVAQSAQTVLEQILHAVTVVDKQSNDYFRKLVKEDGILFKGMLHSIKWLAKGHEMQKNALQEEKLRLHEQLPPGTDPVGVAAREGSCLESIRVMKERYISFVKRLLQSDSPAVTECVKKKLVGVELTLQNTDNLAVLLDTMLRSTDDIDGCLANSNNATATAENQQFRSEMQQLQGVCGQNVASVAMKLASIQEAHTIVDTVATDVTKKMNSELHDNVYNVCTDTVRRMTSLHKQYQQQLTQLEDTFQSTLASMLQSLIKMQELVMRTDPSLHNVIVQNAYAMELVVRAYYNRQSFQQMMQLMKDASDYCQEIKSMAI